MTKSLDKCPQVSSWEIQTANEINDPIDSTRSITLQEAMDKFAPDDEQQYRHQSFSVSKAMGALAEDMIAQSDRIEMIEQSLQRVEALLQSNNNILQMVATIAGVNADDLADLAPPNMSQ